MKVKSSLLLSIITPSIALLMFLAVWEIGVSALSIEKWLFPAPSLIANSLWTSRELIYIHTIQTISETLLGLFIAILVGATLAILMEWSAFFRNLFKPLLIVSQTIPFIVLAPLLIIWLGYGVLPKIVVIVLACFFPISMSMYEGFRSVDVNLLKLMKSMRVGKLQTFRLVKLPASMPSFFSGLKIAGAYAVGVAVVSEWLGAEKGLGIFLLRSAKSYQTEAVFASIVVISLLSLVIVGIIELSARRFVPWFYAGREGTL